MDAASSRSTAWTEGIPAGLSRSLVVAAHPDDIEAFAGGSIGLLADSGRAVTYALVTRGEVGCDDMSVPLEQAKAVREAEQRTAARTLRVQDVRWVAAADGGSMADGEVFDTAGLRVALVRLIRGVRPELVLTFDPSCWTSGNYVNHSDHRGTGAAAIAATWPAAANPRYYPELLDQGLAPHRVRKLWLMLSRHPNHAVDIGAVVDRKAAALAAHASQLPDQSAVRERVIADARRAADRSSATYGERFLRVRINAPEQQCD